MLSKMLPWDFFQKFPKVIPRETGLFVFLIDEPYLEKLVSDTLNENLKTHPALYSGTDITRDFLENEFVNLSFFTSVEPIKVINAENIPATGIELLTSETIDFSQRLMILFFVKSSKAFLELSKNKSIETFQLEEPRFWEGAKLWQFILKTKGKGRALPSSQVSAFILEHCENNFESLSIAYEKLAQNFSTTEFSKIQLNDLKELFPKERFDFFSLIDLFHQNPTSFFKEILKKEPDREWYRSLFAFMQGHLLKVLYPEEVRAKGKPSKYDQTVLMAAEKMSTSEVKDYLKYFSALEIRAKEQDVFLENELRARALSLK